MIEQLMAAAHSGKACETVTEVTESQYEIVKLLNTLAYTDYSVSNDLGSTLTVFFNEKFLRNFANDMSHVKVRNQFLSIWGDPI